MKEGGKRTERIRSLKDLVVYRKPFDAAMKIFEISKTFPREELYSLTDQILQRDGVREGTKPSL